MGSRILSRSFHVLRWKPEGEEPDEEAEVDEAEAGSELNVDGAAANGSAMDVDTPNGEIADRIPEATEDVKDEAADDEEDEQDDRYEDPADVAMVPMADMLNGRFDTETVGVPLWIVRP
jgi:SET domain-containing protein 6